MSYKTVIPVELSQGMSMMDSYVLMMAEPETQQGIPIVIGMQEAQAIAIAKKRVDTQRPTTHLLLQNIMTAFGLNVKEVRIDKLIDGIFYASIVITDGLTEQDIDSRASDAVVMAINSICPILMETKVIEAAGCPLDALVSNLPRQKKERDEPSLEQLLKQLRDCEENEDYEQAAVIQRQIDERTKGEAD